ncbi:hypothetical protein [Methanococcus sp. CF]
MIRRNINFDDEKDLEDFKNMAKELGYTSLSSFAKNSMKFMHLYKTRNDEMLTKMDVILAKMEDVMTTTESSFERFEKKIDDSFEKFLEAPTDSEFKEVYDKLIRVLSKNPDIWMTYEDFKIKTGIEGNVKQEEILQKIIMGNIEFKAMVERKGRYFRARDEALPMGDIKYVVRD